MTSGTDPGTPGEVPVALTVLRASARTRVYAAVPGTFPGVRDGFRVLSVRLDGLAALQKEGECDHCGRSLSSDAAVLGKLVTQSDFSIVASFFSPTCFDCFAEDRGGYYSTALAALVMET